MILLGFILVIFTCIYARWVQVKTYWLKRKVAHHPPHPIFGNFTFLLRQNAAFWMRSMYEHYKEPYVGIWLFWKPALLVHSREIARNIFIKDSANFRNRLITYGSNDPIGKLNLFALKDPLWSDLRRRLTVFFTSSKLRGLQVLMTSKSKELIKRIENEKKKSKYVELRTMFADYTTDVIGTASFGVVCDATLTGESPIRSITKEYMRFSLYRGLCWCSGFFLPQLGNVFRFTMFPKRSNDALRNIFRTIVALRGGYENKVTEPKDLLDILIKIRQEADPTELDMTEDMMLAQAAIFLQGGFDTSATTLAYCIYELAHHPEIQKKVWRELQEASEKHGDEFLDANVLSHLVYLNCVINENLRKYPVIAWLDRIASADYKVDDHLTIAAGTQVFINMIGIHKDPEIFPDPDRFNPDRFLPENEGDIKPYSYMPFGDGPRKCIGIRFGLSTIRHALAAVLLNFEARVPPHATPPESLQFEKKGLLFSPGEDLLVEFVPRKTQE